MMIVYSFRSTLFFNMLISLSNNINQQHQIQFQSAKYLEKNHRSVLLYFGSCIRTPDLDANSKNSQWHVFRCIIYIHDTGTGTSNKKIKCTNNGRKTTAEGLFEYHKQRVGQPQKGPCMVRSSIE